MPILLSSNAPTPTSPHCDRKESQMLSYRNHQPNHNCFCCVCPNAVRMELAQSCLSPSAVPTWQYGKLGWQVVSHAAVGHIRKGVTQGRKFPVKDSKHLGIFWMKQQVVQPE